MFILGGIWHFPSVFILDQLAVCLYTTLTATCNYKQVAAGIKKDINFKHRAGNLMDHPLMC